MTRRLQLPRREQKIPILLGGGRAVQRLLARIGIQADADIIVFGGLGLVFDDYWFFRKSFEGRGHVLAHHHDGEFGLGPGDRAASRARQALAVARRFRR
jgi:V/A-type H+-transporting ATPase subunit B